MSLRKIVSFLAISLTVACTDTDEVDAYVETDGETTVDPAPNGDAPTEQPTDDADGEPTEEEEPDESDSEPTTGGGGTTTPPPTGDPTETGCSTSTSIFT